MDFTDLDKEMAKRTLKQYCSSWNELRYDEIRNKPYFIGKRTKDSSTAIFCPINCDKILTCEELKALVRDCGSASVNLAIYDSDSTVVQYEAQMGLKAPDFLKDTDSCSFITASDSFAESSRPTKKRKVDATNINLVPLEQPEQNETCSTTDCLQIDLQPSADSDLSVTDHDASEESDTVSGD